MLNCQYARRVVGHRVGCVHPSRPGSGCFVPIELKHQTKADSYCCETCSLRSNRREVNNPRCCYIGKKANPAPCASCGGKPTVSVHSCEIHGECIESTEERNRLYAPDLLPFDQQGRQMKLAKQKACDSCPDCSLAGRPVKNLHAIAVRFNPAGYRSTVDNYETFRAALPESLPLLTLEVVYPGQSATIQDAVHISANERQVLWQKERLINLAESMLPAAVDAIAWLDADLIWPDEKWIERAKALLSNHNAVQLFEAVDYGDWGVRTSAVHQWQQSKPVRGGSPGGAWAARRDWFRSVGGLPDRNPNGGADQLFCDGLNCIVRQDWESLGGEQYRQWAVAKNRAIHGKLTPAYLSGVTVKHLPHGNRDQRKYLERFNSLKQHDFDPEQHLQVSDNGLLEWTPSAPDGLVGAIRQYFLDRREDSTLEAHG